MTELWESADQVAAGQAARQHALAVASVEGFESYVSVASSAADFDNRLAMIAQPVEASVLDATGDPSLVAVASAHLRERWDASFADRQRTAAAQRIAAHNATGDPVCHGCKQETYADHLKWCEEHDSPHAFTGVTTITGARDADQEPPDIGSRVHTPDGEGKVVDVSDDGQTYTVDTGSDVADPDQPKQYGRDDISKTAAPTGDYAAGIANGKRDRLEGVDPQGVGFGMPGDGLTDYEQGYWEGYGLKQGSEHTADLDATLAAFFRHKPSADTGAGGLSHEEWDIAREQSRQRREKAKQQPVQQEEPLRGETDPASLARGNRGASVTAFDHTTNGQPMAHPYGHAERRAQEPEPAGTRTFHLPQDHHEPGWGMGSFEHEKEVADLYDPRRHRANLDDITAAEFVEAHLIIEASINPENVGETRGEVKRMTASTQRLAYDPDAMFPNVPPDKRPYPCPDCGLWRNAENCPHCDAEVTRAESRAEHRGPTIVDWLMHGLLPSGAMASVTAAEDLPAGYESGTCRTCGGVLVGKDGRWLHDPRYPTPNHPDGSVAGDAHRAVPKEGSKQAVNESANGTERYQSQPQVAKDSDAEWGKDPWDPPSNLAPWSYFPGAPIGRNTASAHTAAEFGGTGVNDEFSQARTPVTTRPRVHPKVTPGHEFTMPNNFDGPTGGDLGGGGIGGTDQFGGGGTDMAGGGVDYSAPTFEQQVAAKIGKISRKVIDDNPHLTMAQARVIAMQVYSQPGVTSGGKP